MRLLLISKRIRVGGRPIFHFDDVRWLFRKCLESYRGRGLIVRACSFQPMEVRLVVEIRSSESHQALLNGVFGNFCTRYKLRYRKTGQIFRLGYIHRPLLNEKTVEAEIEILATLAAKALGKAITTPTFWEAAA